jgi:hypothetical protein
MKGTKKISSVIRGLMLFLLVVCGAGAEVQSADIDLDRPVVAWAGFSLAGDYSQRKHLYPLSEPHQTKISRQLYNRLKAVTPQSYDLLTDDKLDIRTGNTLALTLALDNESVVVRKLAGVYQAVVEVSATLLVFDFDSEEKAVIASFPVGLGPYIETFETHAPTQLQLATLVEQYWFGGLSNMPMSLIEQSVSRIQSIVIKYKYAAKIGMGDITISDAAKAVMNDAFSGNRSAMNAYLARQSARLLSTRQQVSVVPYVADSSVTQLALRFTGKKTTVLLKLSEPDYTLNITLEKFARKLIKENKHQQMYTYAVRARLRVADDFDDVLFDQTVKDYVHKKIVRSQAEINDWAVYQGALEALNIGFLEQITAVEKKWLKLQGYDSKQTKQTIEDLRKVAEALNQCR